MIEDRRLTDLDKNTDQQNTQTQQHSYIDVERMGEEEEEES